MDGAVPEVWIEAGGGQDLVRADMIVVLRLDETGRLTAQLRDEARVSVTLLEGSAEPRPPDDFHRRLIKTIGELDGAGPRLVRARYDGDGWRWVGDPM
ncbi:hypothetical protein E1200_03660 [Actinomadura sp. GC306]|uniref:hypothetical protein n=1 Tax=Actinomadura sp. GC306 TaxID=2530367 RepID=UPI00104FE4FD|nr:hypothetical protein [Actinomadura sp. GC306]TDC70960.1 hypothetical protein E1200_03660 [Actinomadura sp. GC306]